MRTPDRLRRIGPAALVLAGLTLGSGCVYWRLNELRGQLADFDTHCTVTSAPGPVIRFHKPVLKPGDIPWLIGLEASEQSPMPPDEIYTYRFLPRAAAGAPSAESAWEIRAELVVRDGRIAEMRAQKRFNEILNQEVLGRSFRGALSGRVSRRDKETGWVLDPELEIPTVDRVFAMLGPPLENSKMDLHDVLEYQYDLAPMTEGGATEAPDFTARFLVDRADGRVVNAFIRIGTLSVRVIDTPEIGYEVFLQRRKGSGS